MTDALAAEGLAALPSSSAEESDVSSRTSGSSPGPGNGTGVFIPACILDGSAMSNPAIAARFPRRQRRGSAPTTMHGSHSQPQHGDSSPSSGGSCRSEASAPTGAAHQERGGAQQAGGRNGGRHHGAGGGSGGHSTSAKNPFAATPKNIRQQQLLCNLMAAADSFTEGSSGPAAPAAGPAGASRMSLDCSAMPPPCLPGRPSVDRVSLDMTNMSRATSRTSLESWGYMQQRGRNSCDLNGAAAANRASMESSYSASMRSSMDRASCWSGRPSVDSTFSAYAPAPLAQQQQQHQVAAAAAAAAVAARASFEAALPPNPTGNSISRMGMWQHAGRASCDLGALSPAAMPTSAFSRYSLDSGADGQAAAAAVAAAASVMQLEQQQRSLSGLLQGFDSSAMSNVSSGSMDSASTPCPPSPATPAELAAAAAARAARRGQMAQLQNIIDSMGAAGISGETAAALATLTAQGVPPETAALLLFQAQQKAAAAASNGMAPEALLFQQQMQQIMQANQVAAANSAVAQAAAASQLYAATAARSHAASQQQRQQQSRQCWQNLGFNATDAELLPEQQEAQLPAATYDANALQQQLEALQCMQL